MGLMRLIKYANRQLKLFARTNESGNLRNARYARENSRVMSKRYCVGTHNDNETLCLGRNELPIHGLL